MRFSFDRTRSAIESSVIVAIRDTRNRRTDVRRRVAPRSHGFGRPGIGRARFLSGSGHPSEKSQELIIYFEKYIYFIMVELVD